MLMSCGMMKQALEKDVHALRKEEKERLTIIKALSSQRDHMSRMAADWDLKLKNATREAVLKGFLVQVEHADAQKGIAYAVSRDEG